jgi:hypothetical protein
MNPPSLYKEYILIKIYIKKEMIVKFQKKKFLNKNP